jgi:hypothetical protein
MEENRNKLVSRLVIGLVVVGVLLVGTAVILIITAPNRQAPAGQSVETDGAVSLEQTLAAEQVQGTGPAEGSIEGVVPTQPPAETTESEQAAGGGEQPPGGAAATPVPGAPAATDASQGAAPTLDQSVEYIGSADEHDTVLVADLSIGDTVSGTIASAFDAHNWQFQGSAGQAVTINVTAIGDADPEAALYGPDGVLFASNDDSGGTVNSLITATLPSAGTYTVRITAWMVGDYQLTVE